MNRIESRILIYYVYYLSDGPEKTPEPPIQYTPDSADTYIDKTLNSRTIYINQQFKEWNHFQWKCIEGGYFITINHNQRNRDNIR